MIPNNKIRPHEERRRTVKYSDRLQPDEYTDNILKCGGINQTLISAERSRTDKDTNAAVPSDEAVEEMRNWSIEKRV